MIKRYKTKTKYFDVLKWENTEECLDALLKKIKQKGGSVHISIGHDHKGNRTKSVTVQCGSDHKNRLLEGRYVIFYEWGIGIYDSEEFERHFTPVLGSIYDTEWVCPECGVKNPQLNPLSGGGSNQGNHHIRVFYNKCVSCNAEVVIEFDWSSPKKKGDKNDN